MTGATGDDAIAAVRASPARLIEYTHGRHDVLPVPATLARFEQPALIDGPGPRMTRAGCALANPAVPQTVEVSDDAQCDLPPDSDLWTLIALSCFRYDGHAVPIIDGGRLFGAAHP